MRREEAPGNFTESRHLPCFSRGGRHYLHSSAGTQPARVAQCSSNHGRHRRSVKGAKQRSIWAIRLIPMRLCHHMVGDSLKTRPQISSPLEKNGFAAQLAVPVFIRLITANFPHVQMWTIERFDHSICSAPNAVCRRDNPQGPGRSEDGKEPCRSL